MDAGERGPLDHRLVAGACLAGATVVWATAWVVRRQSRLVMALEDAQQALAESAAEAERARIAREVHDVVAHSLTVTMLHVASARLAVQDRPDEAVAALVEAERLGRQSLADVRRAVGLLNSGTHGAGAQPLPSLAGLESLVAQYVAAGVRVDLATSGSLDAVPAATSLALYRIAEESLANAARHAPGARVAVELGVDRQRAVLRVVNGPGERRAAGAVPGPNDGLGLVGMRQRAELVGGRVVAERAGSGWRVEAEVPLQGAAEAP